MLLVILFLKYAANSPLGCAISEKKVTTKCTVHSWTSQYIKTT